MYWKKREQGNPIVDYYERHRHDTFTSLFTGEFSKTLFLFLFFQRVDLMEANGQNIERYSKFVAIVSGSRGQILVRFYKNGGKPQRAAGIDSIEYDGERIPQNFTYILVQDATVEWIEGSMKILSGRLVDKRKDFYSSLHQEFEVIPKSA